MNFWFSVPGAIILMILIGIIAISLILIGLEIASYLFEKEE